MNPSRLAARALAAGLIALVAAAPAAADETDNITCRTMVLRDSQDALDGWVNERIRNAVARANRKSPDICGTDCLFRILRREVGARRLHPLTFVPHARLATWVNGHPEIDRCRMKFRDSIYGARPYNLPWLLPITGRIIFLADSIHVSGRTIGIDKINHFLREGLAHRDDVEENGERLSDVFSNELGVARPWWRMTEHGLKGRALTGVVAYADLAAGYGGYQFWRNLLSLGRPDSYVSRDGNGRYGIVREFGFAEYVTDAWDEGLNPSDLHPALARDVWEVLGKRMLTLPLGDCRALAGLPDAQLYVNPACFDPAGVEQERGQPGWSGERRATDLR